MRKLTLAAFDAGEAEIAALVAGYSGGVRG